MAICHVGGKHPLNTGTPNSGPMIVASIRKLGFKPEDIKIIINGHGHSDHAGAFAYIEENFKRAGRDHAARCGDGRGWRQERFSLRP